MPRGIGNISLVAGSMRLGIQGNVGGPPFHNVWSLTISEKTPTLTPGGLAAAAVLMLLAAGYAMRPRP